MTGPRLKERVAIIIGAAQGIGAGIAERFVEEGASILVADRDAVGARETAGRLAEIGPTAFATGDVSQKADVESMVAAALDRFGRVDILVQNAEIFPWTLIEKIMPDEWDMVLAVNLKGTFLAAQACLKPMRDRRYGRMVFMSSITGPRYLPPATATTPQAKLA